MEPSRVDELKSSPAKIGNKQSQLSHGENFQMFICFIVTMESSTTAQ